jgi:hypothetical protein
MKKMTRDEIVQLLDKMTDVQAGSLDRLAYKAGYYKGWLAGLIEENEKEQQFLLEQFLKTTLKEGKDNG